MPLSAHRQAQPKACANLRVDLDDAQHFERDGKPKGNGFVSLNYLIWVSLNGHDNGRGLRHDWRACA